MSDETKKDVVMQDMFGVFDKQAADVVVSKEEDSSGGNFFNPDAKKSPNQVFRGIIKFLPNLHGETQFIEKVSYWVPEGDRGFRFDSPKSLGKYEDCPVADVYWALTGSKNAMDQAKAKKIKYSRNTFALIQVILDKTNPENNGKVMVWKLPFAIVKKINAKMFPSKEDMELSGAEPNNVFNPIEGLPMTLKIPIEKKGNDEYRNYDECDFAAKPMTMILEGEDKPVKLSADPDELHKQKSAMISTIQNGPNLQDLAYTPPTEAILEKVAKALSTLTNTDIAAGTAKSTDSEESSEKPAEKQAEKQAEKPAEKPAATEDQEDDLMSQLDLDED